MPPRGKQANGLLTQRKMLRAAITLFLEKGYEKTTTAEISHAAGMTASSFFRAFPSKEGLLLELVQRMFGGQFALAEQHSTGDDPVLTYAVETALQLHIAELTEPLRELYVTAYTLPSTSAYITEGMEKKLAVIFGSFRPRATEQDWALLELATAGITRSFMVQPCTEELTMERKLRSYLSSCYKLFDVPAARYEPLIEQILRIDFAPKAREIIAKTVRKVDEDYEAAMAGMDAPIKE